MGRPVVITGGGTGGHVFPMQAIAESLRARGLDASEVCYVGSRRGQERTLLVGDMALTLLPGRGVRRSWRVSDLLSNVGSIIGLGAAVVFAQIFVARRRPSVVVSVGGYASFAVSFAAVCWRVPLVLVDFDAVPGAAHRLLGPFAAARCTAFAAVARHETVTGAPLRSDIESIDRSTASRLAAKAAMSPPIDPVRTVVLVMTGSLGSHRVNVAVRDLARTWATRSDRALIHVTGARDYDEFAATKPLVESLDYRVIAFGDMVELWGLCDVAVCRAGAITVAELEVLGIPAVLVPLPGAPHDHQNKNARALADAGGAIVISDSQCTGDALAEALDIMTTLDTMQEMGRAVHALAHPHAADAIADVIVGIRAHE